MPGTKSVEDGRLGTADVTESFALVAMLVKAAQANGGCHELLLKTPGLVTDMSEFEYGKANDPTYENTSSLAL